MPAATHAAAPPLEPPGMRVEVPGIARLLEGRVFVRAPHGELVHVRLADQAPRRPLSAGRSTVASYGGRKFSSIREAQVVGSPAVQSRSLIATGRPASRPSGLPARRRRSISSARARAAGGSTRKKAPTCRRAWRFDRDSAGVICDAGGFAALELAQQFGGSQIDQRHGSLAQDRGNQIEFGVVMRRVGQRLLGRQAGAQLRRRRKTFAKSSAWAIGSTPSVFSSESCST